MSQPSAALTWGDVGEGPSSLEASQVRVSSASEAMSLSTVYHAVRFKAHQIASLPWQLWQVDEQGSRVALDRSHWIYQLLAKPNPLLDSFTFWSLMAYNVELHGAAFAIKRASRSETFRVSELWPVPPSKCEPELIRGDQLVYHVTPDEGAAMTVPASEMLHIRGLHSDLVEVVSPLKAARRAFETCGSLDVHRHSVFASKGSAIIGLLKQTGMAQAEDVKAFRQQFEANFSGPRRAGSIGIVPKGFDFQFEQVNLADQQFLETNRFSSQEVWTHIFGLPPSLLDETKAKYATANVGGEWFVRFSLRPEMKRYEEAVTHAFMGASLRSRYDVELDSSHLTRGDFSTRASDAARLVDSAIWTPNEARVYMGSPLSTDPDADTLRSRAHSGAESTPPEESPEETEPPVDMAARRVA